MPSEEPREGSAFTHQEMRLIFERAGIAEARRDEARRFTLDEIEAIGVQAGLERRDIRRAAASVQHVSVAHRILGAPTRFHGNHFVDHRLGEDQLSDVVEALRYEVGLHGDLQFVPDGVEWRARPALGTVIVHFTARRKGTRISLLVAREDAALLAVLIACGIGSATGVAAGVGFLMISHGSAWLGLTACLTGTIAGAYASMRLIWGRAARKAAAITSSLLGTIVSVTESADDDALPG